MLEELTKVNPPPLEGPIINKGHYQRQVGLL